MPLHGKIVVIKRNGADGVEFPLTASCLFGRKPECDIRIQLPQVSKEHCKIELNENKELILTNLSSVNPTCINGEKLQQSERLKHGDLITIIDRSFRFEYPPPPTPKKKRLSSSDKGEAVKVLQDQQVKATPGPNEKKIPEHSSDTCLKDGSNLPSSLDQSIEVAKGDANLQKKQKMDSMSPFSELYHMVKKDLASKSPWKGAAPPKSPLARPQIDKQEPRKVMESSADLSNENKKPLTPKSAKKHRRSSNFKAVDHSESVSVEDISSNSMDNSSDQEATIPLKFTAAKQKRRSAGSIIPTSLESGSTPVSQKKTPQTTPQKFSANEVAQQILLEPSEKKPKSPKSQRSAASLSQSPAVTPKKQATPKTSLGPKTPVTNQLQAPVREPEESEAKQSLRTSPRANAGKRSQVQDVLQELVAAPDDNGADQASSKKHRCDDLPLPMPKRKRVSFGSQLSPELFDKRLPPNSPLRRGATPGRRSLGFSQKPQSLLRRASTIGLMAFQLSETVFESPTKNASPKRASLGKSPKIQKVKTPSPAKTSPSPKARTPSPKMEKKQPKTPTPAKTASSPKARTPSPKKEKTQPKTPTPAKTATSPKARTPSPKKEKTQPKTPTPAKIASSPKAKTPSPKKEKTQAKTPTPAKTASSPKAKTPSPENQKTQPKPPTPTKTSSSLKVKTPSPRNKTIQPKTPTPAKIPQPRTPSPNNQSGTPATPMISQSAKRISSTSVKTPLRSCGSVIQTPTTQGRFSITRIATPSPDGKVETKEDSVPVEASQECVTPKASCRRSSLKASARKTPRSALKSAFEVIRSRRSGASRANLKVISSWADIVKFGQVKPQVECGVSHKVATKKTAAKGTKSAKSKTPARKLKEDTSTGHADSPATIVIGKACVRAAQRVGAAPKIVHNIAIFKKDMKMDEDLTGVADIFKTPARRKSRRGDNCDYHPETPIPGSSLTEISVMNTPEESGEMLVSPMSVARAAYNSEAVSRLLENNQNNSLDGSQINNLKKVEAESQTTIQTPLRVPAPSECLTGIKKLMRTPKQKAEPIHDLRGKLLKTPKEPKSTQEESYEGVKELLRTPKQGTPVEHMAEIKQLLGTQEVTSSPVLCATGLKNLMKTPKDSIQNEDDLTGVKQLMQTPRVKGAPVENAFGLKRLMKTPKQKGKPVEEDLTGIQQMMKTPKQKSKTVEVDLAVIAEQEDDLTGVKQLMKTPRLKGVPVENAFGVKRLMKTPKQKEEHVEDLTGIQQMMKTPKQKADEVVEDFTGLAELVQEPIFITAEMAQSDRIESAEIQDSLTLAANEDATEGFEDKENICPVESTTNEVEAAASIQNIPQLDQAEEATIASKRKSGQKEEFTTVDMACRDVNECAPVAESAVLEATSYLPDLEREEKTELTPLPKTQCGGRAKAAHESLEENYVPAVVSTVSVPLKGRRGKAVIELQEPVSMLSPVRKSVRGRIPKNLSENMEANQTQAVKTSADAKQVSECPPQIVKPKRGRKAEQVDVEAVNNVAVTEATEPSVEAAPVKVKRGQRAKLEVENLPVIPTSQEFQSEAADEKTNAAADSVPPEPSVKPKATTVKAKRGRRVKQELESPPLIPVSQELDINEVTVEAKDTATVNSVAELSAVPDVSLISSIPAVKAKRGRRAKQELEEPPVVPVSDHVETVNFVAESEATEPSLNPEVSLISPVPVAKAKRGRKAKQDLENPPVVPAPQELIVPEAAVETEALSAESVELQISAETDLNIKNNTRTRRGRTTKKEPSKKVKESAEPSTAVEEDITSSVVVVAEPLHMHVVKPGRGRRAQPGALKNLAVPDESKTDIAVSVVESEHEPVLPSVKSGQRTKSKHLKAQSSEEVDDQLAAAVTETEEHVDTVVRNVRVSKRTKKPNESQVLDSQEKVEDNSEFGLDADKHSEAPVNKSARGKRAAVIRDEPEGPIKRGRRGAATSAEVPPPVVKPTRGRRAALKTKQGEVSDVATEESVKGTSKEANITESKSDELVASQAGLIETVCDEETSEVPAKRGRRNARTVKVVNKAENLPAIEEAEVESKKKTSKKVVSWNSDLVTLKNIETLEPPAAKRVPQQKAKKKAEPAVEASIDETPIFEAKQPADLPAKGGKGRVVKKLEEPAAEKSEAAPEENVPVVRRGRAGASLKSKQDEVTVGTKGRSKRKELDVADETTTQESLPKRRKCTADSAVAPNDVAIGRGRRAVAKEAVKETPEVKTKQSESASKNAENKHLRGKRKAAEEVDSVPAQSKEPVSETTDRRGTRGQKKNETDVSSAPVRRTRRK